MKFFMPMKPPTVTDQEHRIGKRKDGSSFIYKDSRLSDARAKLRAHLVKFVPDNALQGAVSLRVMWLFESSTKRNGSWKTTKPDTDNLQKMLKDVMTELHFWKDDAQVCDEHIQKRWVDGKSDQPGILIEINNLEE